MSAMNGNGYHEQVLDLPPHAPLAERAALVSALYSTTAAQKFPETLSPSDFYVPGHPIIAGAVAELIGMSRKVDPLTVIEHLRDRNNLEYAGGSEFITGLWSEDIEPKHFDEYAEIVREKSRLRQLQAANVELTNCLARANNSEDALAQVEEILAQCRRKIEGKSRATVRVTADKLQTMKFDPIRWALPDLLPEGLGILGGRPKQGKSWWALQLCASVALGGVAFSKYQVEQGEALYLGLEDSLRRLKARLDRLIGQQELWPKALTVDTRWPRLNEGGLGGLARYIRERKPRLIVIDTFARVREKTDGRGSVYTADSDALTPLQELALENNVHILCVMHLRKLAADDWVDSISGSAGITGPADAIIAMFRKRNEDVAKVCITGRDIDERELGYRLTPDQGWKEEGNAEDVLRSSEEVEVLAAIKDTGRPIRAHELADLLGITPQTARQRLFRMAARGILVNDGSHYSLVPRNSRVTLSPVTSPGHADTCSSVTRVLDDTDAPLPEDPHARNGTYQTTVTRDTCDNVTRVTAKAEEAQTTRDSVTPTLFTDDPNLPDGLSEGEEQDRLISWALAVSQSFPWEADIGYGEMQWRKWFERPEADPAGTAIIREWLEMRSGEKGQ